MRLRRSWLPLGLACALAGPLLVRAAIVYKWIDADGVVHFSDQPVPGAEKIITAGGSTKGILSQPAPDAPPAEKARTRSLASVDVAITAPAQGQTFSGGELVTPHLSVKPEPGRGVTISWSLNGAPVSEAEGSTSFTLPDLPRGSYTLTATLTDTATGETKSADPVTFNVLRPSLLSPQHK